MIADRYRRVGLDRNPFQAGGLREDCAVFVERGLPDPGSPGRGVLLQVIGGKGFGKSTHVAHWRRLQPGPLLYVPRSPVRERWRRPRLPGPAELAYGDEIDRMPRPLRFWWFRSLARRRATAVIGTHVDLTREAERAGLTVITHQLPPLDLAGVTELLEAHLQAAADQLQAHFRFSDADVARIARDSQGVPRMVMEQAHRALASAVAQRAETSSGSAAAGEFAVGRHAP